MVMIPRAANLMLNEPSSAPRRFADDPQAERPSSTGLQHLMLAASL